MKVLVTGAKGFVGRNLCLALENLGKLPTPPAAVPVEVVRFDIGNTRAELEQALETCDFVFHLAGVNRPNNPAEFHSGNAVFTEDILGLLTKRGARTPIALSSSTQALLDNDYGRSKLAAERAVFDYAEATGAPVFVFRFANVFGKWCRPNYNSAIATWCHNIAHDLPIMVRDERATVTLVYIDDVVSALTSCLGGEGSSEVLSVSPSYTRTLGEITSLIRAFREEPTTLRIPDQSDGFSRKLYATFLSYLPDDAFAYPLTMHGDARGSFTELFRSSERGQVSVNVSKPGVTKGQHWHHTKHEKFCVVSGRGLIRFRKMDRPDAPVIDYRVCGDRLEVVRIPPGYTHCIVNEGEGDMVTVMWANELFDPARPDTFREEV